MSKRAAAATEAAAPAPIPAASGPRVPGAPWVIAVAVAFGTSGLLPQSMLGTLAVQMRASLHFSAGELGAAASIIYATAALSSMPGARVVERLGASEVMRLLSVVIAVGCLGIAIVSHSYVLLIPWLVLFGIAFSTSQAAVNLFLWQHVPSDLRGTAFGLKQSANPLSTLFAGLAVPVIALTIGWRWAFVGAAVFCLASAASVPRATMLQRGRREASPRVPRPNRRPLVVLAAAFAFGQGACSCLALLLVSAGVNTGLSRGGAGLLVALASVFGLIVRVANGLLVDRREYRHFVVVAVMILAGTAGFVCLAVAAGTRNVPLFIPAAVIALSIGWGWNGVFSYALVHSYPRSAAWATGVTQTGGQIGSVVFPLGFGLVVGASSYAVAWTACAVSSLIAAFLMVFGGVLVHRAIGTAPVGS